MAAGLRPVPFAVSLAIHGAILAWVASGPIYEKEKSLYAREIAPHASKVIWYDFRQKLPAVKPAVQSAAPKAPRAEVKLSAQEIAAGSAQAPRANQFIWQPAPKLAMNKDLQSPNILALHPAKPPAPAPKPKLFTPPPEAAKPAPAAAKVEAPPEIHAALTTAHAPEVHLGRAPLRNFVAPAERTVAHPAVTLPAPAPALQGATSAGAAPSALGSLPAVQRRAFVAPQPGVRPGPPGVPLPQAPLLAESSRPAAVSMAIVGLNPANAPAPLPEGSRDAQFSAGPQRRATGGADGANPEALLTVPGLLVRNANPNADRTPVLTARAAAPTSAGNLGAALRTASPAAATPAAPHVTAIKVSSAPDSPLNGRDTYQMMVQMPNVTSYTGSWMIWFAERQRDVPPAAGALSPPVPLRKVDPKYYPSAMADRVEGKVRLTAVIRSDGHVDSVALLMHLDDRLDQSSEEAISKWQFEPALRNGQPVDVDVVFEIPFRLAPQAAR